MPEIPGHLLATARSPSALSDEIMGMDGSLPDLTAPFAAGEGWDTVHQRVLESGLAWEFSADGQRVDRLPVAAEIFARPKSAAYLLSVWVGAVRFNAHYFEPTRVDFDVPIEVLGDSSDFDCLHAFTQWLAVVVAATVVMAHEGDSAARILEVSPVASLSVDAAADALRLADLRNVVFVERGGAIAPRSVMSRVANLDEWLATAVNPDEVTAALCHVHLYDEVQTIEDEAVLYRIGEVLATNWALRLEQVFPGRRFDVSVTNEPDDYGPTLWAMPRA